MPINNYYQLNQIRNLVDLKDRALKYRMLTVKKKYANRRNLLYKKGRTWNIHHSILFEFDRARKTRKDDQSLVTIAPHGNYCTESLVKVVEEAHHQLSHLRDDLKVRYYIEKGERGKLYHVHFLVNLSTNYESAIRRACSHYISANIDVRKVFLERNLITYLEKEVKAKGVLTNHQVKF